eukprot:938560-Pyramimonas_sp.AAC.1
MQLAVGDVKCRRLAETVADLREQLATKETEAEEANKEKAAAVAAANATKEALQVTAGVRRGCLPSNVGLL